MATEDATRVFERFWRSDPSRTRSSGGAGLGLAIVSAIAGAHGGRAEVQSAPGQGSVFRVHLPHHAPPGVESYDTFAADASPPPPAPVDPTIPVADLEDP
jgi:two-component system OmpR family sensor kinase